MQNNKKSKAPSVWSISLIIVGILSLVVGIACIVGFDMPHVFRIIIATIQIITGITLMIATVFRFKK